MEQITIGTRSSKLALIQTNQVIARLQRLRPDLRITVEHIHTTGDRVTDLPLTRIGGDGVFVTEIERALRERRIDLAVHSLKDLPTAQPEDLRIIVTGPREDVRDAFVLNREFAAAHGWSEQGLACVHSLGHEGGAGLRIGTCSLRRTAQVRALYPRAEILPLRGNVDTRLRKLDAGDYDVIVLAAAGVRRLELDGQLGARFFAIPVRQMLPAPGQGALALEVRAEVEMLELVASLGDPEVQAATAAERMFMRRLGAGCYLPVAAYGEFEDGKLVLRGLVAGLDGRRQVRVSQSAPWSPEQGVGAAEQLGVSLAEQALSYGAAEIIDEIRPLEKV